VKNADGGGRAADEVKQSGTRAVQAQDNEPDKQQDQQSIKSVLLKVTGQSYSGIRYVKSAQLNHTEAKIFGQACR
jgi:hypothetical protein